MKINSVVKSNLGINQNKFLISNPFQSANINQQEKSLDFLNVTYPQIYFTGKINPSKLDIISSKKGIIKTLDSILHENLPDVMLSDEEIELKMLRRVATIEKRMQNYVLDTMILREEKRLGKYNSQQAFEKVKKILKETRRLIKDDNMLIEVGIHHIKDEKTDYNLIEEFKDAVLQDHFNLSDVFHKHYEDLRKIHSIQELREKFPNIQIPTRPEDVIAEKLVDTLTREFYENLKQVAVNNDMKTFSNLISAKIIELLDKNVKVKSMEEAENYLTRLSKPMIERISLRLENAIENNSFSSIPEFRKVKKNLISDDDIKLMSIDYDDYILSVIREQYLNLKNPNEIIYSNGDKKIKVSSIKDLPYKFDKIPNRIKGIIKTGENIQAKQRSYDNYTPELFRQRLEFYGDRLDDEQLLKHIVDFNSCKFEYEDIVMLKKFLNGLDSVWDEKMTLKELIEFMEKNSIAPVGTEKLNRMEQDVAIAKLKIERKKLAALYNEQKTFDLYINLLYKNKMNYIAELCSSYKPEIFEETGLDKSKIIINTIKSHLYSNENIVNTEGLSKALFRKITYFDYLKDSNFDKKLFDAAENYARNKNGTVDIEKAGKYIINSNIVSQYPQSMQYVKDKEILETIINYLGHDKEKAIEYLCKYDDYIDMLPQQKSKISNILKIFDINTSLDKNIIKQLIEKDYLLLDTSAKATMTDAGKKQITATITSNAKKEIYEYYKFPKCLDLFSAFEDALSQFATNKNSSGIKRLGRNNNSMKDIIELKIMGYSDRLIDYTGSYRFDTFSNTGFH